MQDARADVEACFHGRALREIEQHGGKIIVFAMQFDTADEVGRIFLVGEPARLFGVDAPIAEHIDRGAMHFALGRSEEHTSELQSLMRISYAVFCLKKKN